MSKWDFLYGIQKSYDTGLEIKEDSAEIINKKTNEKISVFEERYNRDKAGTDAACEYIVCFATQHRHFDDLCDVDEYVRQILDDEVLPVEFYKDGKARFGGELSGAIPDELSPRFLAAYFGLAADQLTGFEYEIRSWSGKRDVKRRKAE